MTYVQFHLIFILPPIFLLVWLNRHTLRGRPAFALVALAFVALLYTTPWDNYLVYKGVWGYGPERVVATIGYVPLEEYLFFVLQPFLTGLWFYLVLPENPQPPPMDGARRGRATYVAFWILTAAAGSLMLMWERTLYLGLILGWAGPVIAGQTWLAGPWLSSLKRSVVLGITLPTLYLWGADRVALELGIWHLNPSFTTGWHLAGLPIEEAAFFLLTNVLVVKGVVLFRFLDGRDLRRVKEDTGSERRLPDADWATLPGSSSGEMAER